ncbi:MAG: type II toxin-antitoxin system HicA family toxin, partial [Verrucomicrobia bacterium]|nr:type II toxin-antitoxin system HicA family toxin [Verrucomicrobiota bacterium]
MIADAVGGYFEPKQRPKRIRLHFSQDPVLALKRLGFSQLRQTGSHLILRKDSRTVVVPQHKPLKPGTLKG